MALGEIVLCDSLLKLYLDFKNGNSFNTKEKKTLEQLLAYYKPHQTNKDQYDRIKVQMDSALEAQLQAAGFNGLNERDLAKKTKLKLILTDAKSAYAYPYVNIDGCDSLKMNFTGTFKQKPRSKCIAHLTALCENARNVTIYDKYLCDPQKINSGLLDQVFHLLGNNAKANIEVLLSPTYFSNHYAAAKAWWTQKKVNYPGLTATFNQVDPSANFHDRYMKISSPTGTIEVLLSSGFDYLFQSAKDFTYVVNAI